MTMMRFIPSLLRTRTFTTLTSKQIRLPPHRTPREMSRFANQIPAETPLLSASRLLAQGLAVFKGEGGSSSSDEKQKQQAISDLQLSLKILTKLDPYLDEHIAQPPASFDALAKAAVEEDWQARHKEGKTSFPLGAHFSAGPYEGMFVAQVARSIKAKRVLEIGMFCGTTTACIADRLDDDAEIVALELDGFLKELVTPHFEKAGKGNNIDVRVGPAKDTLDKIAQDVKSGKEKPFDLIFIDADKTGYQGYFDTILDHGILTKEGVMLIDNTLYKGSTFLGSDADMHQLVERLPDIKGDNAAALKVFNDNVTKDERVESTILPVRDGVTWINRLI